MNITSSTNGADHVHTSDVSDEYIVTMAIDSALCSLKRIGHCELDENLQLTNAFGRATNLYSPTTLWRFDLFYIKS